VSDAFLRQYRPHCDQEDSQQVLVCSHYPCSHAQAALMSYIQMKRPARFREALASASRLLIFA
jgi:hypothetical protein